MYIHDVQICISVYLLICIYIYILVCVCKQVCVCSLILIHNHAFVAHKDDTHDPFDHEDCLLVSRVQTQFEASMIPSRFRSFQYSYIAIQWGYSLTQAIYRPYLGLTYGRYLHFRILKWPLSNGKSPVDAMNFQNLGSTSEAKSFFKVMMTNSQRRSAKVLGGMFRILLARDWLNKNTFKTDMKQLLSGNSNNK